MIVNVYLKDGTDENGVSVNVDRVETISRNQEMLLLLYNEARIVGEFPWKNIYGWAVDAENDD